MPTIPLRLNYILWIEDLLNHSGIQKDIVGVDIGCGASCIYCLLAVRLNSSWRMFALEVDSVNAGCANENIATNHLDQQITVIPQSESNAIFNKLFAHDPQEKSFCLCNPPFFCSVNEVVKAPNRSGKRKAPTAQHSGSPHELVFEEGGELGFVKIILRESLQLRSKIQIYSTMLGCKRNVGLFIDELKANSVENFTTTEFVQGKTTRWGIAWSFRHDLRSFKSLSEPLKKPLASKHVLKHELSTENFEGTVSKLRESFSDLKIEIKVVEEKAGEFHRWELTAYQDTWSNQRRRKRAAMRNEEIKEEVAARQDLHLGFELRKGDEKAEIQMFFLSGSMGKDCSNQILQFIKNKSAEFNGI